MGFPKIKLHILTIIALDIFPAPRLTPAPCQTLPRLPYTHPHVHIT